MALIDLKSDLSWYGKKKPGQGPNADRASTDFVYNDDLSVSVRPYGFDDQGFNSSFPIKTSKNAFLIDDNTKSFRGTSTRLTQLGQGSLLPIGPTGNVHKFDLPRTGFNPDLRYDEIYNSTKNSGLADTYTKKSPIDDMYNKFKVRDEVYDPFGYAKPPFILRGIQRDDNSDPQRFGIVNSPEDIPRGGIITATQRASLDVARISKWLSRPTGLYFAAKQQSLHMMNPNREGAKGMPQSPIYNANSSKVWTQFNLIEQILGGVSGTHVRKHGLLPIDIFAGIDQDGNILLPSPKSNYGDILQDRLDGKADDGKPLAAKFDGENVATTYNRLVNQYRLFINNSKFDGELLKGAKGEELTTVSGRTGPGSVGGIGNTSITRAVVTTPNGEIAIGDSQGRQSIITAFDFWSKQYSFGQRYYAEDIEGNRLASITERTSDGDSDPMYKKDSLSSRVSSTGFSDKLSQNLAISGQDNVTEANSNDQLDYEGLSAAAAAKKENNKILDFRKNKDFKSGEVFKKDEPGAGPSTREELLTRKLKDNPLKFEDGTDDKKKFDGIGDSDRAELDNPAKSQQTSDFPDKQYKTSDYETLGKLAEFRKSKTNTPTDFRISDKDNAKEYINFLGADASGKTFSEEEPPIQKLKDFDGVSDPKGFVDNPAKPEDQTPDLAKYKTLSYGSIQKIAKSRKANTTNLFDFRTDAKYDDAGYNSKLENSELIRFSIGGIKFKAYINDLSDNFSPGFSGQPDVGRVDPRYLMTSWERSIDIGFTVAQEKSDEPVWSSLQSLADKTLPKYSSGAYGQGVHVRIGNLYNTTMLIDSLTYSWDTETPWILDGILDKNGKRQKQTYKGRPMYTDVQCGFKYLGSSAPKAGAAMYG